MSDDLNASPFRRSNPLDPTYISNVFSSNMGIDKRKRLTCSSVQKVTAAVLLSFLTLSSPSLASRPSSDEQPNAQHVLRNPLLEELPGQKIAESIIHKFTLRHIFHHGTYQHPDLHQKIDIQPHNPLLVQYEGGQAQIASELIARSRFTNIQRLKDRRPSVIEPMLADAREGGYAPASLPSAWIVDSVLGPDITDKDTVLNLANMAANAYAFNESSPDWQDIDGGFNRTEDFGWDGDGLRGHIFADETNSTIVIGIKGTTPAVFDGEGTTTNDKWNDNLFASCCCAQQGAPTWTRVCDCATSTYTCNQTCIVKALQNESRYYAAARNLYSNVTKIYPDSEIWLTGHSLGGAVSSLLGLTYGLATVTFEAVPEALAAARLGLPYPPDSIAGAPQTRSNTAAYHFGHTADPIYMGVCNGAFSFCSMSGYAFESQCHSGQRCVYDVVSDKGWRVGLGTHSIRRVIDEVIKEYDTVPECAPEPECVDCYNWNYYDSNSSITKTTSSSKSTTKTRTRTSTCETPGWWGCLDETTTTTTSLTSTTTTTTTATTCKTPGWFGRCLDETTTTSTTVKPATATQTAQLQNHSLTLISKPPPLTAAPAYSNPRNTEI